MVIAMKPIGALLIREGKYGWGHPKTNAELMACAIGIKQQYQMEYIREADSSTGAAESVVSSS